MKIRIHGITDGKHNIELKDDVINLPDIFPEFFGEVELNGTLIKIKNRFNFNGNTSIEHRDLFPKSSMGILNFNSLLMLSPTGSIDM